MKSVSHFHDGGRYHIETNLLICGANQWTGFYMITASVMKGLNKIQQGGVDVLKALKALYAKGSFSRDCILMIDGMYLEKYAQYQSGEYVGVSQERNLFKGIVAFIVVGSNSLYLVV